MEKKKFAASWRVKQCFTLILNERCNDMELSEWTFLEGIEYMLDDYGKDSMSPELLKKYELLFNTVTNIHDASVVEYITYIWE